ncbi:MAG: DUF1580 domain-containing protein [Gemmataceae bacterium]|nr:DUF1580 domain-containing protein [Gemmataceae bacterium]
MNDSNESLLIRESWLSLSQAAKLIPSARNGRPVSASCLWRWFKEGVLTPEGHRIHLETLRVVNRFVTSEPAVRRFILAQQRMSADKGPSSLPVKPPRTPGQRNRASERAAQKLQDRGA